MKELKDLFASLPEDVLSKIEITQDKVSIPSSNFDANQLYRNFSSSIHSDDLTTEKAIYVAALYQSNYPTSDMSARDILKSKL